MFWFCRVWENTENGFRRRNILSPSLYKQYRSSLALQYSDSAACSRTVGSAESNCSLSMKKGKGEGNIDLYSTSLRMPLMCSNMDHPVLVANNTISAVTCKHSSGSATTPICTANAWVKLTTHLSTPRRWMAELTRRRWLTYRGRFTPRRSPVNCTSWHRPGKVCRS